jgi:uncharacterized integral membrane protein
MQEDRPRGGGFKAKLISLVVILILVLVVLAQNSAEVTFRFLFWSAQVSQLLLVLIVLAAGFVAGYVVALMRRR